MRSHPRNLAARLDADIMATKPPTLAQRHALAVADIRRLVGMLERGEIQRAKMFAIAIRDVWAAWEPVKP